MKLYSFAIIFSLIACSQPSEEGVDSVTNNRDTVKIDKAQPVSEPGKSETPIYQGKEIETGNTTPDELLAYAQTLIGIPYKYGSTDPKVGFDCSGFITHVFNHFKIAVPRSSINFTNVGTQLKAEQAKAGDLVLFTGTDSAIRDVGHMGIVVSNVNNEVSFIHSTSGKQHSVTITPLNKYYMGRFVKIIRVFKQNNL